MIVIVSTNWLWKSDNCLGYVFNEILLYFIFLVLKNNKKVWVSFFFYFSFTLFHCYQSYQTHCKIYLLSISTLMFLSISLIIHSTKRSVKIETKLILATTFWNSGYSFLFLKCSKFHLDLSFILTWWEIQLPHFRNIKIETTTFKCNDYFFFYQKFTKLNHIFSYYQFSSWYILKTLIP